MRTMHLFGCVLNDMKVHLNRARSNGNSTVREACEMRVSVCSATCCAAKHGLAAC